MPKTPNVKVRDVPLVELMPLRQRNISKRIYEKLSANIQAVGLIEPLCVFKEDDHYLILDGFARYRVLIELGMESAPCIILPTLDGYTPNKNVNYLSNSQTRRMLRKALECVEEEAIAKAFGVKDLGLHLKETITKDLHPDIVAAVEAEELPQSVAKLMVYLRPERQIEILEMIRKTGDRSAAFVRAQILQTPPEERSRRKKHRGNPWDQSRLRKKKLVDKLQEVEGHWDFYQVLYRQYGRDLISMAIYVRKVLTCERAAAYLREHHAEQHTFLSTVIAESAKLSAG